MVRICALAPNLRSLQNGTRGGIHFILETYTVSAETVGVTVETRLRQI